MTRFTPFSNLTCGTVLPFPKFIMNDSIKKDDQVKFWYQEKWHYGIVEKVGTKWVFIKIKQKTPVKLRKKTVEIQKINSA